MSLIRLLNKLFSKTKDNLSNQEDHAGLTTLEERNTVPENASNDNFAGQKVSEFVEKSIEEIKDQSSTVLNAIKEGLSELEENTRSTREAIAEKARDITAKIDGYIDKALEKAEELKEEEKKMDRDNDSFADEPIKFDPPLEERHSGFFEKAKNWLEKTEKAESNSSDKVNNPIQPLELPKDD